MTFTAGAVLTAAQLNTHLRDNLNETAPAKATTAGSVFAGAGTNSISEHICPSGIVSASEGVVATSYGNISGGTVGPTFTVTTGTFCFVSISCNMLNNTGGAASYMGYAVSGASTIAADDTKALYYESSNAGDIIGIGTIIPESGLTAGSNTFTAKYRVGAGTGTFASRRLSVLNFGQ